MGSFEASPIQPSVVNKMRDLFSTKAPNDLLLFATVKCVMRLSASSVGTLS